MTQFAMLIDGQMVEGAAQQPVINPATEECVAMDRRDRTGS